MHRVFGRSYNSALSRITALLRVGSAQMKSLVAATICIAVLYAIDALWFDGWYFTFLNRAIYVVYVRW
jgi:hypothetical protein